MAGEGASADLRQGLLEVPGVEAPVAHLLEDLDPVLVSQGAHRVGRPLRVQGLPPPLPAPVPDVGVGEEGALQLGAHPLHNVLHEAPDVVSQALAPRVPVARPAVAPDLFPTWGLPWRYRFVLVRGLSFDGGLLLFSFGSSLRCSWLIVD